MRNLSPSEAPSLDVRATDRPHRLHRLIGGLVAGACVAGAPVAPGATPASAATDISGAADIPWLGRYADSVIVSYEERIFDRERFLIRPTSGNGAAADFVSHEGHRTRIVYRLPPRRSTLEVYRNFEQRLLADGFERIWTCELAECRPPGSDFVTLAFGNRVASTFSQHDRYHESPRYGVFRRGPPASLQMIAIYVGDSHDGPALAAVQSLEARPMEDNRIGAKTR